MSLRPRRLLPALPLVFLALLSVAGCSRSSDEGASEETTSAERPALVVRTTKPTRRNLDRVVTVTADVVATAKSDVGPRLGGQPLLSLEADIGDRVRAGQRLAKLDDRDLKRRVAEAELAEREASVREREASLSVQELEAEMRGQKLTLERAEKALTRAEAQAQRGAIAAEALETATLDRDRELASTGQLLVRIEKAKVTLKVAKRGTERAALDIQQAQADLAETDILAPIEGIVIAREGRVGQVLSAGQRIFELIDPKSLVAEAKLPQATLRDLRLGQRAKLESEVAPGLLLHFQLALIEPTVDATNGVVKVRFTADPKSTLADEANAAWRERNPQADAASLLSLLRPGLFLNGGLVVERREGVLVVPRKAIAFSRGRPFVFVAELIEGDADSGSEASEEAASAEAAAPGQGEKPQHRVRRVWFQEGLASGGAVELMPERAGEPLGLGPDDLVVEVGQDRLRDGDPVRLEALMQAPEEGASDDG